MKKIIFRISIGFIVILLFLLIYFVWPKFYHPRKIDISQSTEAYVKSVRNGTYEKVSDEDFLKLKKILNKRDHYGKNECDAKHFWNGSLNTDGIRAVIFFDTGLTLEFNNCEYVFAIPKIDVTATALETTDNAGNVGYVYLSWRTIEEIKKIFDKYGAF